MSEFPALHIWIQNISTQSSKSLQFTVQSLKNNTQFKTKTKHCRMIWLSCWMLWQLLKVSLFP